MVQCDPDGRRRGEGGYDHGEKQSAWPGEVEGRNLQQLDGSLTPVGSPILLETSDDAGTFTTIVGPCTV